jgi:hypothetical protein
VWVSAMGKETTGSTSLPGDGELFFFLHCTFSAKLLVCPAYFALTVT